MFKICLRKKESTAQRLFRDKTLTLLIGIKPDFIAGYAAAV